MSPTSTVCQFDADRGLCIRRRATIAVSRLGRVGYVIPCRGAPRITAAGVLTCNRSRESRATFDLRETGSYGPWQ